MAFEQLTLPDGRHLEWGCTGPETGRLVLFHHGTPSAATPIRALERAAHAHGLRFLTMSRPGYGESSRLDGRAVVDVVADAAALLQAIGAEECLVAGWSGGGPHALACSARLPGVRATLVMAGVAPYGAAGLDWMAGMGEDNVTEFSAALDGEAALRPHLTAGRDELKDVNAIGIIEALDSLLPDVDRAVLSDEFGEDLAASFRHALRHGVDGWVDDTLAFTRPWGFDLNEIVGPVAIWQGGLDLMVPGAHGEWLSANVPAASSHLHPGEGHLSLLLGAIDAMVDELVSSGV